MPLEEATAAAGAGGVMATRSTGSSGAVGTAGAVGTTERGSARGSVDSLRARGVSGLGDGGARSSTVAQQSDGYSNTRGQYGTTGGSNVTASRGSAGVAGMTGTRGVTGSTVGGTSSAANNSEVSISG